MSAIEKLMRSASFILICLLLVVGSSALGNGEAKVMDPALREKFVEAAKELRCPTCTGLSVLESDAEFSVQIKKQVREQIEAGKDITQIRQFFVERYGPWILREPPKQGFNGLAWFLPIGILAFGPFILWLLVWRRKKMFETYGVRATEAIVAEFRSQVEARRLRGGVK